MILKYQQSLILLAKSVLSSNLGKVPSQLWTTLVLVTGITIINMISSLLAVLHHSFLLSFSLVNLNDINENSNVRYSPPPRHHLGLVSKSQLPCVYWHLCKVCFCESKKLPKMFEKFGQSLYIQPKQFMHLRYNGKIWRQKKKNWRGDILMNAPCEIPLFGEGWRADLQKISK